MGHLLGWGARVIAFDTDMLMVMRYAMIMAGGAGTRLWPLSRQNKPKQLLRFIQRPGVSSAQSLLELAAARLDGLVPEDRRLICTGERYRNAIRESLPAFTDQRILGEPEGRDTVNAVGLTAAVLAKDDPDAIFAVLTADQIIEPVDVFQERVDVGFTLVEEDPSRFVTFAITPTFAATGYGYVRQADSIASSSGRWGEGVAYGVAEFVEKPPLEKAEQYLASGDYGWNAGMFVFHAGTFLSCLERFKPEIYKGLMKIQAAWGTADQQRVLGEVYRTLEKVSVDYAVMEPASGDEQVSIAMVKMPVSWLDVGSWPSYCQTMEPDAEGNHLVGAGEQVVVDSSGNLVFGDVQGHTTALLGVEGMIVVHTADATLVMPMDRAQDLKSLHSLVNEKLQ